MGPFSRWLRYSRPSGKTESRRNVLTRYSPHERICGEEHDAEFVDLEGDVQDEVLKAFEAGEVEVAGMRSEAFFSLLRNTTIEGVYSDRFGGIKNRLEDDSVSGAAYGLDGSDYF